MFAWEDIPWDDIAFPTVRWALDAWRELGERPARRAGRQPGGGPPRHEADRQAAAQL